MITDAMFDATLPTIVQPPVATDAQAAPSSIEQFIRARIEASHSQRGSVDWLGIAGGGVLSGVLIGYAVQWQQRILKRDRSSFKRYALAAAPVAGAVFLGATTMTSLVMADPEPEMPTIGMVETRVGDAPATTQLIVGDASEGNVVAIIAAPPGLKPKTVIVRQVRAQEGDASGCADILVENANGDRATAGSFTFADDGAKVIQQLADGKNCTIGKGDDVHLESIGL